jgi:hypothetical protein
MNGHGLASTTTSRSSSTNWGGDFIGLEKSHWPIQRLPRPPVTADLSQYVCARDTDAQSGDQPLVVPHSQSSLQPTRYQMPNVKPVG